MNEARELLAAGVRVVDLAADYRIQDVAEWAKWYGMEHGSPDLVAQAVYGLPELNCEAIRGARLVANPGCYPTAVQLGFLPLIEAGAVDLSNLIADCKSGVSGAGRKAEVARCWPRPAIPSRLTAWPAIAICRKSARAWVALPGSRWA